MEIRNYRDLDVWKKGIGIVDLIYDITKRFPSDERFGLVSQMQRAAVSIPANIAEGHARQHTKEYKQFCYIALGSCAELETLLVIAKKRSYLEEEVFKKLEEWLDHESRMIGKLVSRLRF